MDRSSYDAALGLVDLGTFKVSSYLYLFLTTKSSKQEIVDFWPRPIKVEEKKERYPWKNPSFPLQTFSSYALGICCCLLLFFWGFLVFLGGGGGFGRGPYYEYHGIGSCMSNFDWRGDITWNEV